MFQLSFHCCLSSNSGREKERWKDPGLIGQKISGMRGDIFGIFLANSFQDLKESGELHAENRGGKRMK